MYCKLGVFVLNEPRLKSFHKPYPSLDDRGRVSLVNVISAANFSENCTVARLDFARRSWRSIRKVLVVRADLRGSVGRPDGGEEQGLGTSFRDAGAWASPTATIVRLVGGTASCRRAHGNLFNVCRAIRLSKYVSPLPSKSTYIYPFMSIVIIFFVGYRHSL